MTIQRFTSLKPVADLPQLLAVLGTQKPSNGLSREGSWYSITNRSDTDAEITIYDAIGGYGITASDFIRDISAIKSSNITLRINSPGGEVFDGIAIFNAIKRHKATVTAYIDGIAASAASFIAMAADRVVMSSHAQIFIHDAHGLAIGNAGDMRQMADVLDKFSDDIASIYSARAGGTTAEWRERMRNEMWVSDQEAVDLGLADAIDGEEPKAKVKNVIQEAKPIDFRALINEQIEVAADIFAA